MAKKSSKPEASTEPSMTKAEAIRRTIADGITKPTEGSAHILKNFGIEVTKGHFSASVSQIKKKDAEAEPATEPKPAAIQKTTKPVATSSPSTSASDTDLLAAMESLKPMVAALGVEKIKRLADLLG